jgi:hypothetical protein
MLGRYELRQSPLFRLRSRKKLASLLDVTVAELESLAQTTGNYTYFDIEVEGKDPRPIQNPSKPLKKVQRKVTGLLGRIQAPEYLFSAYKGTSYVRNAAQHTDISKDSFKIDIKKFFARSDARRIETLFLRTFECSPDVAAILTKLNSVNGHIPTGGCSSSMLSYWAYRDMFREIADLAAAANVIMTICVDDMTFTGAGASRKLRYDVERIIKSYGLRPHKRHHFLPGRTKVVTGVAVTPKGLRVPNARRKLLHDAHKALAEETDVEKRVLLARRLMGRATEAEQIEPSFRGDVVRARAILHEAVAKAVSAGFEIIKGKIVKRPDDAPS